MLARGSPGFAIVKAVGLLLLSNAILTECAASLYWLMLFVDH